MAEKWIKGAIKNPGALTKQAQSAGMSVGNFENKVEKNPEKYSGTTKRRVALARTLSSFNK